MKFVLWLEMMHLHPNALISADFEIGPWLQSLAGSILIHFLLKTLA